MFLTASESQQLSAEFDSIVRKLRAVPERVVRLAQSFANEVRQLLQRQAELRPEVFQERLADAQARAEGELEELRRTVREQAERAKTLGNRLATSWTLGEQPQTELTRLAIETRLLEHQLNLSTDESLATTLRLFLQSATERQAVLAFCWLAGILDTRPDWRLAESAWRDLQAVLPAERRELIRTADDLSRGVARALQAVAGVSLYIRDGARSSVTVPLWQEDEHTVLEPV